MMKKDKINFSASSENNSASKSRVMDFVAKIACLVAAFIIWFYVMSTDVVTLERDFTVPVSFENESMLFDKSGWSVLSGKETSIVVSIKGKRNIVNQITNSDIYAFVDVSTVEKPGRQDLEIKISVPSECEVTSTSVSSISPYIDKKITKNVPVKVVYADYVISSGHQLDDPQINTDEVLITGPESEIKNVVAAQAELFLGNVTQTVNTASPLTLINEAGETVSSNYITLATKSVNVTVKLYALKDVPLNVDYKHGFFNDQNVKISINPSVVTLRGEPSVLEKIDSISVATLDEKKYLTNTTQNVSIDLPAGVSMMNGENNAVITLEHINTGTKQITVNNITLLNSGGLDCKLQSESINVILRGPFNQLSQITEDDISVTVDMKNYSAGSGLTVVPATIKLASDYEKTVYELESYNVTVNIK